MRSDTTTSPTLVFDFFPVFGGDKAHIMTYESRHIIFGVFLSLLFYIHGFGGDPDKKQWSADSPHTRSRLPDQRSI